MAQQTYPHLFEICPLIMRTQAILLVRDAIVAFCSAYPTLSLAPADIQLYHRSGTRSMEAVMRGTRESSR